MNVVFLDIDGVLNSQTTTETINGLIGIDSDKVERLSRIVKANNAVLMLTSSWRIHWWKRETEDDEQHPQGAYLDKKLAEYNLKIEDIVPYAGFNRGRAIRRWLGEHPDVSAFVVLDDDEFDFRETGIWLVPYHVKTTFYSDLGGLQETHVLIANKLFKKQVDRS